MASSFASAALESLSSNDPKALQRAVADFKSADVNLQIRNGTFGACAVPSDLKFQEGDTILHMAMRNQKWLIRTACVVELAADAHLKNSSGISAPGLQLRQSAPRLGAALLSTALVMYEVLDLGRPVKIMAAVFCCVAGFDTLLVCASPPCHACPQA